ncbi:MAG: GTP-binding protein, partial [Candidatus Hodarchaeota archaeon]
GAEFLKQEEVFSKRKWKFQIWDIAGQPRFAAVRALYYRTFNAAILVYDVTRPESLFNLRDWVRELQAYVSVENVPIVVLANKVDLRQNAEHHVTTEEGLTFVEQLREETNGIMIGFLETSARTGFNVREAFNLLAGILAFQWSAQTELLTFNKNRLMSQQVYYNSFKFCNAPFCPLCGSHDQLAKVGNHTGQESLFCLMCENVS